MGMPRYSTQLLSQIRQLRREGFTFPEICQRIGQHVPKGSLSYICKDVAISKMGQQRIGAIIGANRQRARIQAVAVNRQRLAEKISGYREANLALSHHVASRQIRLIALAMLYLGEGSKWPSGRSPSLGSSDPKIVRHYIDLLIT